MCVNELTAVGLTLVKHPVDTLEARMAEPATSKNNREWESNIQGNENQIHN